jgi:hypothetical protein
VKENLARKIAGLGKHLVGFEAGETTSYYPFEVFLLFVLETTTHLLCFSLVQQFLENGPLVGM